MKFSYETQGAITYLVCEIESGELIDNLTIGMLTNNHIAGVAPVLYTEMNGQQFLKYNISAKVTSAQFFSGNVNKQRVLKAFQNILNAFCSADEYMIDQNCFSMTQDHVFLNVSSCETSLVCIPVVSDEDENAEVIAYFKNILESSSFDSAEDTEYIKHLTDSLNSSDFSVYSFKSLVDKLISNGAPQPAKPAPSSAPQPPAPSFDATVSMDSMTGMQPPRPFVANATRQPTQNQAPVSQPVTNIPSPPPAMPRPTMFAGRAAAPAVSAPQPVLATPPVKENKGFAIPGQQGSFVVPGGGKEKASKPQKAPKPAKEKKTAPADKKMSLLGLLANYSKENAEIYKKQKEEAKSAKSASQNKPSKKSGKQAQIPASQPVVTAGNQPPIIRPMGMPNAMGQPMQQSFAPPVQPMPVQNSFNETTVLSPMMAGGETTVLSESTGIPTPCLFRSKSGERIQINKPVFRIGKEKSYVDYFIADNTAISRSHANIHSENGEYFIEDTNSTNHTYLNGVLVTSNVKTKIKSGDIIRLANEDFTFSLN